MRGAPDDDELSEMKPRFFTRRNVLFIVVMSPWVWVAGHMFFEGRRTADALCDVAHPGMRVETVIAKATALHIDFLDDRVYRKQPQSTDGELMSVTSPFTVRRTCRVVFRNGVVQNVLNQEGPN